jgi:hypothetical protein
MLLLKEGLYPESKVLDIGCGCLRVGYWLIHFLNPRCYFGMEPNRRMLEAGIEKILEPGLIDLKRPRFDCNADFDFSVFGERFDFFVARSIWTHASKTQIKARRIRASRQAEGHLSHLICEAFVVQAR